MTLARFGEIEVLQQEPTKIYLQQAALGENNSRRTLAVTAFIIRYKCETNRLHRFFTQHNHRIARA
jgi:hypothetical protein